MRHRLVSWASAGLLIGAVDRRSALLLRSLQPVGSDLAEGVGFRAIATACGPPAGTTRTKRSALLPQLRPPRGPAPRGRFSSSSPPPRQAIRTGSRPVGRGDIAGQAPPGAPFKLCRPSGQTTVRGHFSPISPARVGRPPLPCWQVLSLKGQGRRYADLDAAGPADRRGRVPRAKPSRDADSAWSHVPLGHGTVSARADSDSKSRPAAGASRSTCKACCRCKQPALQFSTTAAACSARLPDIFFSTVSSLLINTPLPQP